jgi:ATP-binding cassette subfamily B protein
MDEATSALDDETEKAIMKKIYEVGADKTMIMIAHRLSTIEGCDRVYRVMQGKVIQENKL